MVTADNNHARASSQDGNSNSSQRGSIHDIIEDKFDEQATERAREHTDVLFRWPIQSWKGFTDKAERRREEREKSRPFECGGYSWIVWVYPNGNRAGTGQYLSLYLQLHENANVEPYTLRAQFLLGLANPTDETQCSVFCSSAVFSSPGPGRGWPRFVEISKASQVGEKGSWSRPLIENDQTVIVAYVRVSLESVRTKSVAELRTDPSTSSHTTKAASRKRRRQPSRVGTWQKEQSHEALLTATAHSALPLPTLRMLELGTRAFRCKATVLLFKDSLQAFDLLMKASPKTACKSTDYKVIGNEFQVFNQKLITGAINDAVDKSMAKFGLVTCLTMGTQRLFKSGGVEKAFHEVALQTDPASYRRLVEAAIGIRSALEEDIDTAFVWDSHQCVEEDKVPVAYRSKYARYIVAIPTLQLGKHTVKGRAFALNSYHKKKQEAAPKPDKEDPADVMWDKFVKKAMQQ